MQRKINTIDKLVIEDKDYQWRTLFRLLGMQESSHQQLQMQKERE